MELILNKNKFVKPVLVPAFYIALDHILFGLSFSNIFYKPGNQLYALSLL